LDAIILLVSVIVDGLSVTAVRDGETCFGTTECDLKMLYIAPATTGVLFLITAPMATTMIWYLCHMNRKQDKREVDPSSYEHLLRVKDSRF
jgi:hypothetical protein